MLRVLLFVLALLAATAASAQSYEGRLALGDDTLNSGEFVHEYEVQAVAGDTVRAVVTSLDFDTYVILVSPSGEQVEDDDCTEGETTRSCGLWVADVDGPIRILVTSFQPGEVGEYALVVTAGEAAVDAVE